MIPKEIIEDIRNKADIVAVISEYVQLKKRGKNYLGLCPFHSEKDASFTVSPEKQLFHCFGCNEGGNVFAFIMKMENIGFAEAAEELGAKVGVAVPKAEKRASAKKLNDQFYQVMLLASKYFQSCLEAEIGRPAGEYLKNRGITLKTSKAFNLGFAPPGWDNLFKHLISKGGNPKLIEQTGLILQRAEKNGYYDRFRNRLIIPITDPRGRVIAFGGRSLENEEPKYLNSPDSPVYHKGETLFGLNLSRELIKKSKTAVLVEGYFDLITPYQSGITNIVAGLGTALTINQCKLIARYCDNIVLAYDADSAGGLAAERSVELLRSRGLKVKTAILKGGKDPDEVVSKQGGKGFLDCLNSALPFLDFKIKRIISRHNLEEVESKAAAIREIAAVLGKEKDPFVKREYAKIAAALLKTQADTILTEIKRELNYQNSRRHASRRMIEKPKSKSREAEINVIAMALQNPQTLSIFKERLSLSDFMSADTGKIAEFIFKLDTAENEDLIHTLLESLPDEETKKFLASVLVNEHIGVEGKMVEILNDCIDVIKRERLKEKIEGIKLKIKEAEKLGETEKVSELLSFLKSEIS
jgi:DNA primase